MRQAWSSIKKKKEWHYFKTKSPKKKYLKWDLKIYVGVT
jgi:hypothetical protein